MIDDIVELILQEARSRDRKDLISTINSVVNEVNLHLMIVFEIIKEDERRDKEGESKKEKQT